jgi:hypothetical protein
MGDDASVTKLDSAMRRAKSRLTRMVTQEVSLVDRGANGWEFLIRKNGEDMEATTKLALKLPADAKKAIMDGLASSLDKISAIAAMVGGAEPDETAAVPDELAMALKEAGSELAAVGAAYAVNATPEGQDTPEQTPPEPAPGMDADKAAAPAPAAAPPPAAVGQPDPLTKSLPGAQTDTLALSTSVSDLVMSPKTAQAATSFIGAVGEDMAKASMAMLSTVEKAGRKIASGRYKKLVELHSGLGKLLNELAWDENAPAPAAPPASAEKATTAKAAAPVKGDALAKLTKLLEANANASVAKSSASTPSSTQVRPVDGGGKQAVTWPRDLSADLSARARENRKR